MNRRNSLEITVKGMLLAVAVVMALMLSAMAIFIVTRAKGMVDEGTDRYSQLLSGYSDVAKTMYDGTYVTGSTVMEVIDEMTSDRQVSVSVITRMNALNSGYNQGNVYGGIGWDGLVDTGMSKVLRTEKGTSPYEAGHYKSSDIDYINPDATFRGKVSTNANGAVINIRFTQI